MSVKKAIEKLDEVQGVNSTEHCQSDVASISFMELREILLAMDEPEEFSRAELHPLYQLKLIQQRIGVIESKCGCKVKWKEEIERRLAELELREQNRTYRDVCKDNSIPNVGLRVPEPSSQSVECKHEWMPVFIPTQTGAIRHDCYKCGLSEPCVYENKLPPHHHDFEIGGGELFIFQNDNLHQRFRGRIEQST